MVGFLVLIFVTANYVGMISGLRCWTCENSDLFQCKRNGAIKYCNKQNEETCQTEVRYSEGKALIVKTGCKQIRACVNNFYQNPAGAWMPTQCNTGTVNSVCRCCCSSNLCNKRRHNLLCSFPPQRMSDVPVVAKFSKEEKSCGQYPNMPENGQRNCIGGFALRSFCKFSCDEGYRLKGYSISVCVQRGRDFVWNTEGPKCEREVIVCEKQPTKPVNGHSECFGERELGSVCAFACDIGYKLAGSAQTTCIKTEHSAAWSHETPKCNPVCKPLPKVPQNGKKTCFGNGEVGSSCAFECDSGFRMSGLGNTICEEVDSRAFWTVEPPTCETVCNSLPKYPENGRRKCEGDGRLGTTCFFECKVGYKIKGTLMTTCQKKGMEANWDNEFPHCEPFCLELPASPRAGRKRCNGGGQIGTICVFECNKGFQLEGLPETKCQKTSTGADWTGREPTCSPACDVMPTTPEKGNKICHGRGEIGTLCIFECKTGYELVGQYSVACKQTIAGVEWTDNEPACNPTPKCKSLPKAPEYGGVTCHGTGQLGTECQFYCDSNFQLEGSGKASCIRTKNGATWSHAPPFCTIEEFVSTCPPLGELPRGKIECDDPINKEGTICRFECLDVGYELVPTDHTFTVCKDHAILEWTVKKPCCVECSKSKKDIVIAMDSSASINPREWKTMQNFVVNIIRKFNVSEDGVQFSIFQFSSGAKSDGFMYFGRYTKQELIRKVGRMRRIGTGTMTGRALKYAGRRFRDKANRKEVVDMLWVLTDGESEDMAELEKVSEELRKDGIEILALAIGPTDGFVQQMTKMTGDREKVLVAKDMESLTKDVVQRVTVKICQDECAS